jgi:hypothetical protein
MKVKKVAILQSNYIPWKGYFDMIASVDEFILYDDMQYTRRDWRNRNQIKTPQGLLWLTVPVAVKGKYLQSIRETEIPESEWAEMHLKAFIQNYRRAPHFEEIFNLINPIYKLTHVNLSELNRNLNELVCNYLDIKTKISNSWDYKLIEGKTERLVDLCVQSGASEYISGPAAKDYVVKELFEENEIKLTWFDYKGYPEYPQLWGTFIHGVSVLDLLFNTGKEAKNYLIKNPSKE